MKQWGTVDRAREGMNALQILHISETASSWFTTPTILPPSRPVIRAARCGAAAPGRMCASCKSSFRIAKDYPVLGKPAVTGTFDEATENSVKKFQKQFSLTADGVVSRATWNKVSLFMSASRTWLS